MNQQQEAGILPLFLPQFAHKMFLSMHSFMQQGTQHRIPVKKHRVTDHMAATFPIALTVKVVLTFPQWMHGYLRSGMS